MYNLTDMALSAGVLVISLDFELHWGVRDKRSVASYRENLLGVRQAVPAMLELFAAYDIAATWATVGFLLFDSKAELLAHLPERLPYYQEHGLNPYPFLSSIGENEREDPFHFAPSLVRRIAQAPKQELGSHTLSHFYCLEPGQDRLMFHDDLKAAIDVAREKLGEAPRSIVFPRNQFNAGYLEVCRELGFSAYRGNPGSWLYAPRPEKAESMLRRAGRLMDAYFPFVDDLSYDHAVASGALRNVPASRFLRPYQLETQRLEPLRKRRIARELESAARNNRMYHLWWHPHNFGLNLSENLELLRSILNEFRRLRDQFGMKSSTMVEAAAMFS